MRSFSMAVISSQFAMRDNVYQLTSASAKLSDRIVNARPILVHHDWAKLVELECLSSVHRDLLRFWFSNIGWSRKSEKWRSGRYPLGTHGDAVVVYW